MRRFRRGLTILLFIVVSFLCGRAYGWYESHIFMQDVARAALVPEKDIR